MRALIQRVTKASVSIEGQKVSSIANGMLILLGVGQEDKMEDIDWLAGKISQLRIFNDQEGVMNLSVKDTGGDILLVSQFTLHASTIKGNRPSYIRAARPEYAISLYEAMIDKLSGLTGKSIQTGVFGADMQVELVNDGPVTIFIDSKNKE